MEGPSLWTALAAVIALAQLTHGRYNLPSGTRISFNSELTSYDWPLLDNVTEVVWTRNVGPSRVFAWITQDASKKHIVLQVVKTNRTSTFRDERCEFDFNVTDGTAVSVDAVRTWSDGRHFRATFDYRTGDGKTRVGSLDSLTCHHAEWHRELVKRREKEKQDEVDRLNKFKKEGATEATEVDLAKLEIPKGYHFVDRSNSDSSTVRIGYADPTSKAVSLAATYRAPFAGRLKAESLALGKYGVCWREGKEVICAQGDTSSKENTSDLGIWARIYLTNPAQWLGVHNHADGRMLLVAGGCTAGDCSDFELYEVRPGGKVFRHAEGQMSIGRCSNPSGVTVDAFYDAERKSTCFSAVCLDGWKLKYRRICGEEVKA